MVLNNLIGHFPSASFYFYRTTGGAEMDFVMVIYNKVFAIECKATLSPKLSVGNFNAIEDINPTQTYVATPSKSGEHWVVKKDIEVVSLSVLINSIERFLIQTV